MQEQPDSITPKPDSNARDERGERSEEGEQKTPKGSGKIEGRDQPPPSPRRDPNDPWLGGG